MRRDPTEFRERFLRWKNGEQVYKMGIPHYEYGRDILVDDIINTEQLLEYTANKWLNRPAYMRNDLEKPMNDPDPVGEFLVKARGGMKAASIVGDWLKSRQIRQLAEVYRKIRSGDNDVQNYTGLSLRRLNMRWADLQARDPRYRGITSDNPFTWLYDLFVDPVVQYYTKMQKHPIIGPLLP